MLQLTQRCLAMLAAAIMIVDVPQPAPDPVTDAIAAGAIGPVGPYLLEGLAEPDRLTVVRFGVLYTPFVRVAAAAWEAKQTYRTIAAADVKAATFAAVGGAAITPVLAALKDRPLTEPLIYIVALPFSRSLNPTTMRDAAAMVDVKHVVILAGDKPLQPVWTLPYTLSFANAVGVKIDRQGVIAAFTPTDIQAGSDMVFVYSAFVGGGTNGAEQRRRLITSDIAKWR